MPAEPAVEDGERGLPDGTAVVLRSIAPEGDAAGGGDERARLAAEVEGQIAGMASYQRVYGPRAAVCVDIEDAFVHRGVAAALLTALGARAGRLGIETFLIRVGAADVRLLALLREQFGAHGSRNGAYVDLEFPVARD